ncbi:MAG TPA: PspC domain-containing protein [Gemmatimonadota bacterium]|jgi:phage shock protein PspC (stress-responsive transcriptional regulator)
MDFGNPPLRRSRDKRMIAGVMGGIAEHLDLNVTLLRILYVVVSIFSAGFPGILVYLLLWLLIPARRPEDVTPARA